MYLKWANYVTCIRSLNSLMLVRGIRKLMRSKLLLIWSKNVMGKILMLHTVLIYPHVLSSTQTCCVLVCVTLHLSSTVYSYKIDNTCLYNFL